MDILGVKIDNFSKGEIVRKANDFLNEDKFHQIATVNPEFILKARRDKEFRNILNQCDLNVADGVGIKFAFWRKGERLKSRIAGADLMIEILRIANEKNLGVFLAANKRGLSGWEETASVIRKSYPGIIVSGCNLSKDNIQEKNYELGIMNYEIVFCNFGMGYQEKFLYSLKNAKNAKIRLVMGVGGGFDFIMGKVKRAPLILRQIGLEWLWRLIQQPQRIKRIWNAVIIFPIRVILNF